MQNIQAKLDFKLLSGLGEKLFKIFSPQGPMFNFERIQLFFLQLFSKELLSSYTLCV